MVSLYLEFTPDLHKAKHDLAISLLPKYNENTDTFTALYKTEESHIKNTSDIFSIRDGQILQMLSFESLCKVSEAFSFMVEIITNLCFQVS